MQQRQVHALRSGLSFSGCAFILGLVACAGEAAPEGELARTHGDLSAAGDGAAEAAGEGVAAAEVVNVAALSSGASCDVLLAELQNDLLEQVQLRAEQARVSADYYYYGGGVFIDDVAPVLAGSAPTVSAPAAPAPDTASAVSPFAGFSGTTVEVPGIDEGDFVKAEGDRLYLLQGNSLYVLDASDASATRIVSSIAIEGAPASLFVHDGKVAVTSQYDGPLPGQEDEYYYYYYYYPTYTKLTFLDTSGDSISVLRETFVEGYTGGSRRHGSVVRNLVQQTSKAQLDYPAVSYVDIFGKPRSQAEIDLQVDLWVLLSTESIEDSVIEDYLPSTFERVDGQLVEQPLRCGDYLLPGGGLINAGATSIVSLDLAAPGAAPGTATLVGYAEGVYANEDVLLVRQTDYGDYTQPIPQIHTNIHRFELDGLATTYSASGRVAGYVASPFGLDEAGGIVRAATTEDRYALEPVDGRESLVYLGTASHVVTLGSDGGALLELGRSPDLGGVDTWLYQARFLGDHAYAFTFGGTAEGSPVGRLQVVDVSDPAAPALAGQTSTNGYATLVVPFGSDRLLTFGDRIDALGAYLGAGLALFDVADPAAPALVSEVALPQQGYTEAVYDPHAIGIHPERSLISFPFQSYETNQSTLEVFHVSPAVGLDHVASIAPSTREPTLLDCLAFLGYPTDPEFLQLLEENPALAESLLTECGYYFTSTVRRGLFRGDELFAIHSLGVDAYSVYELTGEPIGELPLPPAYPYYYYPIPVAVPSAPVAAPPVSEEAGAPEAEPLPNEGVGEAG